MTKTPADGGPAFPIAGDLTGHRSGMTLRDWFAGQALAMMPWWYGGPEADPTPDMVALSAYHIADAMIAEREYVDE